MRAKRELVRIVRAPDGRITIDYTGRVAGRGAYLCRDETCWRTALERGTVARALGAQVPPETLEALRAGPNEMMNEGGARGQE